MATIGNLFINVKANVKGLVSGLGRAEAKLKRFSRNAQRTGRQMQNLGKQMAGLSVAFAAPAAAGIRLFASFEKSMANVSTMLDKPEQHMRGFTSGIQDMAIEFGEGTDTLSGGLYDILSASIAPTKALETLRVASMAARAGMTDTATAADAITTVLNSYGLSADHASIVSDKLFTIVKRGKTTFAELAPNIGKSASLAHSAGVSIDELSATIAVLTRNGVKTEIAMTAINALISAFATATPAASAAAKELGLTMTAASLKSDGLLGVMQKLEGVDFDELAAIFPNIRALRGVLPAANDISGFAEDLNEVGKETNATAVAFDKMANTLDMAMGQAWEAIKAVGVAVGEVLAGDVRDWSKSIVDGTKDVVDWIRENKNAITEMTSLAVKVGAAGVALLALGTAWRAVGIAMGLVITSMKAASLLLAGLKTAVVLTKGAIVLLTVTMNAARTAALFFGASLSAGGALVMGLAGVAVAFWAGAKAGDAFADALGLIPKKLATVQQEADKVAAATAEIFGDESSTQKVLKDAAMQEIKARQEEVGRIAEEIEGRKLLESSGTFRAVEGVADFLPFVSDQVGEASLNTLDSLMAQAQKRLQDAYRQLRTLGDANTSIMSGEDIDKMIASENAGKSSGWFAAQEHTGNQLAGIVGDVYDAATEGLERHRVKLQQLQQERIGWMQKQAAGLAETFATPQEVFDKQMASLRELQTAGVITTELFDRASAGYAETLAESLGSVDQIGTAKPGTVSTAIGGFKFSDGSVDAGQARQTSILEHIQVSSKEMVEELRQLGPRP